MKITSKQKNILLLALLRKNSRESLTKLSKEIRMPISTVYERIKKLNEKIITRHTALLDFQKLGYNIRVNIILKVNSTDRLRLTEYLRKHPSINTVYKIDNGNDLLFEGIFKDLAEMYSFTEKVEEDFKITKKQVHHVVEEIKKEEFMSEPLLVQA